MPVPTREQRSQTIAHLPSSSLMTADPEEAKFSNWLKAFERLVQARWRGITLDDLVERPWRDWCFLDGDTPEQALQEVIQEQGGELDRDFGRK